MASENREPCVFVSYSHQDEETFHFLKRFLEVLDSSSQIKLRGVKIWNDSEIEVGGRWAEEIDAALEAAKVAVLFLSVNFLRSKFIKGEELPTILEMVKAGKKMFLIPVVLAPCSPTDLPPEIRERQWFRADTRSGDPFKMTISDMKYRQRERVWIKLKEKIEQLLDMDPSIAGEPVPEELPEEDVAPHRSHAENPYDPEEPPGTPAQPRLGPGGVAKHPGSVRAWNRTGRPIRLWCYVKSRGRDKTGAEFTHWLTWNFAPGLDNQKSLEDDLAAGWSYIVIEGLDDLGQDLDPPERFREGWFFFEPRAAYRISIPTDYFAKASQGVPDRIKVEPDHRQGQRK